MFKLKCVLVVCMLVLCIKKTLSINITRRDRRFFNWPSLKEDNMKLDVSIIGPELISRYGYPVVSHTVTTEDGYLLTVFRIPGSPKSSPSSNRRPVFIQHGLVSSSDDFVIAGPNRSIAFLLADHGYDVWLGNARGNLYSRAHVTRSPNDKKFWEFSWHEMGVYDLPAVIDHILKTTKQPQLFYIGHSMGTNMFFVMTSLRPEYNQKVKMMVAIGPAVYSGQLSSFIIRLLKVVLLVQTNEVLPRTFAFNTLVKLACQAGNPLQKICSFFYFRILGYNPKQLDKTMLHVFLSRMTSGSSRAVVEHIIQNFETGRFQTYDPRGSQRPVALMPLYNLSLVTTPVVIIYAQNDAIIRPKGVFRLQQELPNVLQTIRVTDDEAGHRDFFFAINAKSLVVDDVIKVLDQS